MPRHIEPDAAVIRAVLAETGSVKAAAERLGVSRRTLHRWIKKAGIEVERRLHIGEAA
jgi:transcriptional regulator of acetoin/glycerol metabolism